MSAAAPLRRLVRFSLNTADLGRSTQFYREALGCTLLARERCDGASFEATFGVDGGAQRALLGLGDERIELLQFDRPGAAYPQALSASDLRFQHCAVVVADIEAAYAHLARVAGWIAISVGGPQQLPASTGGVSAFKFRDPEGHPLELLAFAPARVPERWQNRSPDSLFLGVDHSAISVADTDRSVAFYGALGLTVAGRSHNRGPEQARLDGVPAPEVEVTALALSAGGPHVELLCYRDRAPAPAPAPGALSTNDIAATRLVFQGELDPQATAAGRLLLDPDGHRLQRLDARNG